MGQSVIYSLFFSQFWYTKLLTKRQIITNMEENETRQWNVHEIYIIHSVHAARSWHKIYVFMFQSKRSDQIVHFSIEMQRK